MFQYLISGLVVRSNCPIPHCIPSTDGDVADVHVRFGKFPPWRERGNIALRESMRDRSQGVQTIGTLSKWTIRANVFLEVCFDDGTTFVVDRDATEVWARWPPPLTLEDTAVYFLGPVLGYILRSRGLQCLHASAFVVEKNAVAVVGSAGRGKSTTAAEFALRGFTILSDDIVALRDDTSGFAVLPTYPQIKLWPDSAQALFGSESAIERISPTHYDWDKRFVDLTSSRYSFAAQPAPLAAAYVLEAKRESLSAPEVRTLAPREALTALLANMGGLLFADFASRARAFEVLARVVSSVPVKAITPHSDLGRAGFVCDAILQDLATIGLARE